MGKIPLILIPGLMCDKDLWESQIVTLGAVADCMVTDRHMHYETIGQIADAIIAEAPKRFVVSGLSMGGYIALEICRKYSDRIQGLVVLDTSARPDTVEQKERRMKLMELCRQQKFSQVIELLLSVLLNPNRQQDLVLRRRVIDMAERMGPEIFLRQQSAIMGRIDQRPNLPQISCPTLVVCGQQDRITPFDCSVEIAEKINGSELVPIKDCGHLSTMEKPQAIAKIMYQWLKTLQSVTPTSFPVSQKYVV